MLLLFLFGMEVSKPRYTRPCLWFVSIKIFRRTYNIIRRSQLFVIRSWKWDSLTSVPQFTEWVSLRRWFTLILGLTITYRKRQRGESEEGTRIRLRKTWTFTRFKGIRVNETYKSQGRRHSFDVTKTQEGIWCNEFMRIMKRNTIRQIRT